MVATSTAGVQSYLVTERGSDVYSGRQTGPKQWHCLVYTRPYQNGLCPELHRCRDDRCSGGKRTYILEYAANDRRPCSQQRQPQHVLFLSEHGVGVGELEDSRRIHSRSTKTDQEREERPVRREKRRFRYAGAQRCQNCGRESHDDSGCLVICEVRRW